VDFFILNILFFCFVLFSVLCILCLWYCFCIVSPSVLCLFYFFIHFYRTLPLGGNPIAVNKYNVITSYVNRHSYRQGKKAPFMTGLEMKI